MTHTPNTRTFLNCPKCNWLTDDLTATACPCCAYNGQRQVTLVNKVVMDEVQL